MKFAKVHFYMITNLLLLFSFLSIFVFVPAGSAEEINDGLKIVIVSHETNALVNANQQLKEEGYSFSLKIFNPKYAEDEERKKDLQQALAQADIILLDMIGNKTLNALSPMFSDLKEQKILVTRSVDVSSEIPRADTSWDEALAPYFSYGGVENMRRLLLYLLNNFGEINVSQKLEPVVLEGSFAYHPAADKVFNTYEQYKSWYEESGKYQPGAPWIGILTYDSSYKNADFKMYTDLLQELEKNGANAILVFAGGDNIKAVRDFFMDDGKSRIDCLLAATYFNFVYGRPEEGIKLFQEMNIPIMTPIYSRQLDKWENDISGISDDVPWQVAFPELEGRIEPVLIGGSKVVGTDKDTGAIIEQKVAIPNRVERIAKRAINWAKLRHKPNHEKKVALIYYNYGGGKDGISASYLNVERSIAEILKSLKKEGYTVKESLPSEELLEKMLASGRNVGSWAPGELEALVQNGAITIPVEQYLKWFEELPQELQEKVEDEWGPAPGNIMVYNNELVLPGIMLGNVFIGPQPMRGWGDEPDKITHSPTLPPTHQYLAFYFWLQKEFKADAVVHVGTHGTLEWLPGRSVGLGKNDWPDVLLGNIPNIYPYIVNNPGEGTQAKRRGYAVIIDHLTPPMVKPELYGELEELMMLLSNYEVEEAKSDTKRLEQLKEEILEKIKSNNIHNALGLDLVNTEFSRIFSQVEEYLFEMKSELMPYGLHTFGKPPRDDLLEEMTRSIVEYDPETRKDAAGEIKNNLYMTTREIDNLLKALEGQYIEPGLGRDPVRIPDVMPTGANFFSFDPRTVPDKAAWETGKKAADRLLENFLAQKGRYPEKVGIVLWATETMRSQGETVAMILRLIGAEPNWDKRGRVKGVNIVPIEELGRPRVDVVVTMSGLFRDTFSYMAEVLDEALRKVALLEEKPQDNWVRKHFAEDLIYYQQQGLSYEESKFLAGARIFSEAPGTYGTGVAEMTEATSAWEDSSELAETYLSRMSYIYGKNAYGKKADTVFQKTLNGIEVATQIRDSLWGVLDNDDVYQYLGGLALAAEEVSGKNVSIYISNTRNARNPRVESIKRFLSTELATRVFNPDWIEGMLKEGYSGSTTINKHIGHLFGVDATMKAVDNWQWQQVAETFVFDENIRQQLTPHSLQSLIGWTVEAARRKMWDADEETLSKLADTYIQSVIKYGVVCCHHTCANIVFNQWIAQHATLSANKIDEFAKTFQKATNNSLNLIKVTVHEEGIEPVSEIKPKKKAIKNKLLSLEKESKEAIQVGDTEEQNKPKPKAYEIKVVEKEESSATSESSVTFYALLGAFLFALIFVAGYVIFNNKKSRRSI